MPELVWKFNNVQHLQVEMVSIVCGLYTTQCVDRWRTTMWLFSASCSILAAFRMCTHHYTTVGIPIFRHQSYPDKGRLIQKSIICWDYVPSGNGLRTGKKMSLALSQRCRKFTAVARTPSIARRVSRVVGWGHGQGFRVDTNWHTTGNTSFHHEKQRDYDLDYHWQQHFWNIWKISYIPIIFQALCGPWILDGSTALRDNDFGTFRWGLVF